MLTVMSRSNNDLTLPKPHQLSDKRLLKAGPLPNAFQTVRPPWVKGRRSAAEDEDRQLGELAKELSSHQEGRSSKYNVRNVSVCVHSESRVLIMLNSTGPWTVG